MRLPKILAIIGIILWLFLGGVILYLHEIGNDIAVLVWATTSGILFILMLSLDLSMKEKNTNAVEGEGQ